MGLNPNGRRYKGVGSIGNDFLSLTKSPAWSV